MVFIKNATIETVIKTSIKNNIGQVIEGYKKSGISYKVNIQPIDIKSIKYTWGEDIISKYQVYADEILEVGDIIIWNNKTFEVEKVIDYINYRLYAIRDKEVIINAS